MLGYTGFTAVAMVIVLILLSITNTEYYAIAVVTGSFYFGLGRHFMEQCTVYCFPCVVQQRNTHCSRVFITAVLEQTALRSCHYVALFCGH